MTQLTPPSAHLGQSRKHADVITPWEVAALRAFDAPSKYLVLRAAADGGQWCLVGRTILARTNILQDSEFYREFLNELWFFKPLNTGDDVSSRAGSSSSRAAGSLSKTWKTPPSPRPSSEMPGSPGR